MTGSTGVVESELDQWVVQYLQSEGLVQVAEHRTNSSSAASTSKSTSKEDAKAAAHAVQHLLEQGRVKDAYDVIQEVCPDMLKDLRLVFLLKRQQFIEWLRLKTPQGDALALACAREELAPLALDAYPEAYLDFKRALLLLVAPQGGACPPEHKQHQHQQHQGLQEELGEAKRAQLAASIAATIQQHTGWSDPALALVLRYWAHLTAQPSIGGGRLWEVAAAVEQRLTLVRALVGGELLEAGLPQDAPGGPLPEERDIQALMTSLGVTRSEARRALKHAPRQPSKAFLSELHRVPLEVALLDELAWEYALCRGLLQVTDLVPPSGLQAAAQQYATTCTTTTITAAAAAGGEQNSGSTAAGAAAGAALQAQQASAAAAPAAAGGSGEGGAGPGAVAAAGSGVHPFSSSWGRSASQSPPLKLARCFAPEAPATAGGGGAAAAAGSTAEAAGGSSSSSMSGLKLHQLHHAWRLHQRLQHLHCLHAGSAQGAGAGAASSAGPSSTPAAATADTAAATPAAGAAGTRAESAPAAPRTPPAAAPAPPAASTAAEPTAAGSVHHPVAVYCQQQAALKVLTQQLAGGEWAAAEASIEGLRPGLMGSCTRLKFALLRCQFVKMVELGDVAGALQMARHQMTPLVNTAPELLPTLKGSMALLVRPGPPPGQTVDQGQTSSPEVDQVVELVAAQLQGAAPEGVRAPRLLLVVEALARAYQRWLHIQRCSDPFAAVLELPRLLGAGYASASMREQQQQMMGRLAGRTVASRARVRQTAVRAVAPRGGWMDGEGGGSSGEEDDSMDSAQEEDAWHRAVQQATARMLQVEAFPPPDLTAGGVDALEAQRWLEVHADEGPLDEGAILQVMEVLDVNRAAAMELLAEHGGSAERVINALFGA